VSAVGASLRAQGSGFEVPRRKARRLPFSSTLYFMEVQQRNLATAVFGSLSGAWIDGHQDH
jgi:hypothetical protein